MKIINHGKWLQYFPNPKLRGAPPDAIFARRDGDGIDWYDYSKNSYNFEKDSIKASCYFREPELAFVISPVYQDITRIFPVDRYVIEIVGYIGNNPEKDIVGKVYDPGTNAICLQ